MRGLRSSPGSGTTLLELLITSMILAILAGAALPVAAVSRRRAQEIQLRRSLRELRIALDTYHRVCLSSTGATQATAGGPVPQGVSFVPEDDPDRTCWPSELDVLIEGVETNIPDFKLRFLRRIPQDPFNLDGDEFDAFGWRLRSTTDNPEGSLSWDRRNVFDVSSGVEYRALDGSYYKDW